MTASAQRSHICCFFTHLCYSPHPDNETRDAFSLLHRLVFVGGWERRFRKRRLAPAAFSVPLPILPTLAPTSTDTTTDYYDVTMQVGQKEIIPGQLTTIWGYNGIFPGPTIVARRDRRVVVRQLNNLPESVSGPFAWRAYTSGLGWFSNWISIGPGAMKPHTRTTRRPPQSGIMTTRST